MSLIKRLAAPALALAMVLVVGPCGLARAQNVKPLNEADLTKLIELQVGDDAVTARVERSGVSFPINAAALERLRKAGASEAILAVVLRAGQPAPANAITYEGILKLVRQTRTRSSSGCGSRPRRSPWTAARSGSWCGPGPRRG